MLPQGQHPIASSVQGQDHFAQVPAGQSGHAVTSYDQPNNFSGGQTGTFAQEPGAGGYHHGGVAAGTGGKVSSATKGARFDETGGAIDDRTGMQKIADKLSPGSDVGKHTSDVPGWAPNAGPSHGYNAGFGPTRFTAGNVASDNLPGFTAANVAFDNKPDFNSRTDISGPAVDYGNTGTGNAVGFNPTHHGSASAIAPDTAATFTSGTPYAGAGPPPAAYMSGTGQASHPSAGAANYPGAAAGHGMGSGASQVGAGGEGPRYATDEHGNVLGTQPQHTSAASGGNQLGSNQHSHINPSTTGVTSSGGLTGGPNDDSYVGGDPVKISKATKGAQYDATGGALDDRTTMQKLKDAFIPGSSVGNHTKPSKP